MQRVDAPRSGAVEFADHDCAMATVVHDARFKVIGAEIDETADCALLAHNFADDEFVETVLRRHDIAVVGKVRKQLGGGEVRVMCLNAQEDAIKLPVDVRPVRRLAP